VTPNSKSSETTPPKYTFHVIGEHINQAISALVIYLPLDLVTIFSRLVFLSLSKLNRRIHPFLW